MTDPVTDSARRVALLVRPGEVADRLRQLLAEAGIENVLQGDPAELAVDALAEARPQIVLVALDPDMEDALERFDAVLGNPDVNVIYEEAELAAVREGWEAARWKRHLLAKLQGHDQVLPPRPHGTPDEPAGLRVQATPEISDEAYAAFDPHVDPHADPVAGDAIVAASDADAGLSFGDAGFAPTPPPVDAPPSLDDDGLTLDISDDDGELAISDDGIGLEVIDGEEDGAERAGFEISFDPVDAEENDGGLAFGGDAETGNFETGGLEAGGLETSDFEIVFDGDAATSPPARDEPPLGLDEHLSSLSASTRQESPAVQRHAPVEPPPLPPMGNGAAEPPPLPGESAAAAPATMASSFGELTLDDGSGSYQTPETKAGDERFGRDLADLDARIASLELVEDAQDGDRIPGVVLVMAGIGGPDAVRQFLGALPNGFPRPVLVQQRLDGGRYDRLVAQMQRASSLPVSLAEPGHEVVSGFVYVLPAEVGIEASAGGSRFTAGTDVLAALPSGDSAIVMLSGSDPASIDAVLKHRSAGALVAGQSPQGCYDPTAPDQLAARGGELLPPAEIAQRLTARWQA